LEEAFHAALSNQPADAQAIRIVINACPPTA